MRANAVHANRPMAAIPGEGFFGTTWLGSVLLTRKDRSGGGDGSEGSESDLVAGPRPRKVMFTDAGWSSSVARWAHNPEVAGSNPVPATDRQARCSRTGPAALMGGMTIYEIPLRTLSGEPTSLGRAPGQGPAHRQRRLQVRSDAAVHRAGGAARAVRGTRLQRARRSVQPVRAGRSRARRRRSRTFCSTTYGVTFPLLEKIDVNGENRHPLYAELVTGAGRGGRRGRHPVELREVPGHPGGRGGRPVPSADRSRRRRMVSAVEAQLPV